MVDGSSRFTGEQSEKLRNSYVVTIDAENRTTLTEGISIISKIRDEIERSEAIRIPLVWFVKFQRTWDEYLGIDTPAYFADPVDTAFDGFEIANAELRSMRDRGDEIGWHYHATGYVHRQDLAHERRVEILRADLVSCGAAIRRRHPEFDVRSFRFGWFFVPDYSVFSSLFEAGIRVDASVDPLKREGDKVARHESTYLAPLTETPLVLDGVCLVPFAKTILTHDWSVVPHEVCWRSHDEATALRSRGRFTAEVTKAARELHSTGASFITYAPFHRYREIMPVYGSGVE